MKMKLISQIDWNLALAGWLMAEQVISGVPALKANSTLQLVCNIVDTIISKVKGVKTDEKTDSVPTV
jgi:hypothetical protein